MTSDRDTTRDLRRRLQARFGRTTDAIRMPEHLVLFEVSVDGIERYGAERQHERSVRRRIDAVAVGLWRKTDHLVHGFEIKASRADLQKELADPDKSEPARRRCDRWWLVLSDLRLLRDDAPPDGWGVLVPRNRGLTIATAAGQQAGEADPRFVAALLQTSARGTGRIARGLGWIDGVQHGLRIGERRGYDRGRQAGFFDGLAHNREAS